MSLDVYLEVNGEEVYSANITHNLNKMAMAVSEFFYKSLWRPDEMKILNRPNGEVYAQDIILELRKGISTLVCAPTHYKKYNAPNGWGLYEHFIPFVVNYIEACEKYPHALVRVSR